MATRTIGTEIVMQGEKAFNDAMKGVDNGLKSLRSDMALVSAEFADNADSMEALTAKQKVQNQIVDQHRAKVAALKAMLEEQKKKYGENNAVVDKYRQKVNAATATLLKEEKALETTTEALYAKRKENSLANAIAERAAIIHERLAKAYAKAEKPLHALGVSMKGLGAVSATAAASVMAMEAAGAAALLGMLSMAKDAAEAAKAAHEAGEDLTASQKQWLDFSKQLDSLDGSVSNAKSAIAGILLPMLSDLTEDGGAFLDSFVRDMKAASGNAEKQTQLLGKYIADGAKLLAKNLPEYIKVGKDILSGVITGFKGSGPELLEMGMDLLKDLLDLIISEAPALAEAGLELTMQLIEGIDGESFGDTSAKLVGKLADCLAEAAPELIPAAIKLIMQFAIGLSKNAGPLIESGWNLIVAILEGIWAGLGELDKAGPVIIDTLIQSLQNSDPKLLKWWGNIVAWLRNMWKNLWNVLFDGSLDVDVNATSDANIDGSHATGLWYVPHDGYLAQLHRGETVLPATEAEAYRSGQSGGKTFNMTINAKSISKEELDMIVEYINRKLGDDL